MTSETAIGDAAATEPVRCPVCGDTSRYDFSGRDLMFDRHQRFDYQRCDDCGTVFQHPMPDMATIATFYPTSYRVYDEQARTGRTGVLRRAILRRTRGYRHLPVSWPAGLLAAGVAPFRPSNTPEFVPGGRLLDVGCGNGRYLSTMRSLGWQVQGVELSDEGVRVCRLADLPVHHGDLASASFPDAAFDLVTVRHVIEHIPTPHAFMQELARVLKPGGLLVVETPNVEALGRDWFGANWYANDVPRHLILFSPRSLMLLAGRYGLTTAQVEMETSQKIVLNSIDYAVGNHGRPSRKIAWRRLLARLYVKAARRRGSGDILRISMRKA